MTHFPKAICVNKLATSIKKNKNNNNSLNPSLFVSYWRFHVCEFQKWNFRFWWNVKIIPRFPNDLFHVFHVGLLNHASSHIFFKEALLDLLFRKTWSKKFKTYQAKLQVATLACSSSTGHLRSNTNQSPKTRGQSKFTQLQTCLL